VLEEIAVFLRQLGGGPGADPANAVPRFVIPAIFWCMLTVLAWRRWRAERAERDGLLALAAALGGARELFMLVCEYGSGRGLFDFERIVGFYPPFEHALELVVEIVAGYAFVASLRGRSAVVRAYLWVGLAATAVLYAATAPAWASFVQGALPAAGPRPEFAQHPADLVFRLLAIAAIAPVVVALLFTRGAGAAPALAAAAFLAFLLDHALMVASIATGMRHAWILSPIRHNLHMWAVPVLLAIYWRETVEALQRGERRLLRGQKLESLGLLAGGVAHDFGNVLAIVHGNLEHALESLPPDGHREALEEALVGTQRAGELTRQLLAYAGRGETRAEPIQLDRLASETARLLRSSVPPGCLLELQLPETLPTVLADATQLRQVVMNLLLNACQAMKGRGGTLTVRGGVQTLAGDELADSATPERLAAGRYVWLEVEDQGVGMSDATRARIFDPFFTTRSDGRGLGLPVVLGVVGAHRGAVVVRSRTGVGTTFRVYLPASTASADAPAGGSLTPAPAPLTTARGDR
jgi:signal transduction histidine kinase